VRLFVFDNQERKQVVQGVLHEILAPNMKHPGWTVIALGRTVIHTRAYSSRGKERGNCCEGSLVNLADIKANGAMVFYSDGDMSLAIKESSEPVPGYGLRNATISSLSITGPPFLA